ncbi:hypothetical protein POUND7_001656 [Theobroma cacao]
MDAANKCDDSVNYNCNKTLSQSSAYVGSSSQQVPIIEPFRTPASGSQALILPTGSKPPLCSSSTKRRRKLTSEVWNHFEKKNINWEDVASCNYCKAILKANSKNGTTALKNHMNTCVRRKNSSIEQCFEKQKQLGIDTQADGKKFVVGLQPLFKMVSPNTIKEDIHKIYCSKKSMLQ